MAAYNLTPLFDGIMAQKRLKNNVFSFYFDKTDGADHSRLILGGVDTTLIKEPVQYFSVVDKYYWTIEAEDILLNGQSYSLCPGGCKVVADTGTSFISGPSDQILSVLGRIFVKYLITHSTLDLITADNDCSNFNKLPNIT